MTPNLMETVVCIFLSLAMNQLGGGGLAHSSGIYKRHDFDNDFEEGTLAPWVDLSEGWVCWKIERISDSMTTVGFESTPPPPLSGKHFLMLKYDLETFDIGILSTAVFLALPGDMIQFFYWISSRYSQFHNIQVFWSAVDQHEDQKMMKLFPVSGNQNFDWRSVRVLIPIEQPTEGRVMIYGFCSAETDEISIGIDDITLIQQYPSTGPFETSNSLSNTFASNSPTIALSTESKTKELTVFSSIPTTSSILEEEYTKGPSSTVPTETSVATIITTTKDNKCDGGEIPQDIDYSPCKACHLFTGELEVRCEQVIMTDVRDTLFNQLENVYIGFLYLETIDGDGIPDKFLGSGENQINFLFLDGANNRNVMEVNSLAFDGGAVNNFYISNCDVSNVTFLSGMGPMMEIKFENSSNLHESLPTIPTDFEMRILHITKCRNIDLIDEIDKLPILLNGIKEFKATDNEDLNDETVDLFLTWLTGFSTNTLETVDIVNNKLTKLPSSIFFYRFIKLRNFRFDENKIQTGILEEDSVTFVTPSYILDLSNCGIHTLKPGAIKGDFGQCYITLENNSVDRFESSTFFPIVDSMYNGKTGRIFLKGNFIDCVSDPCHLAWLLRDNKQFVTTMHDPYCADGRSFYSIKPTDEMFKNCK